jgi:hypothetical protein
MTRKSKDSTVPFSQRAYTLQWRKEKLSLIGASFDKAFAEEFRSACRKLDVKQAEVIRNAMKETIKKAEDRQ